MNLFRSRSAARGDRNLAVATLVAIVGTLLANTLSNFFPLGGQSVGEIANTVLAGVLMVPANYAFSIWGLIYLGLIAYGIYQLGPRRYQNPNIRLVSRLLIVACVAQIVWVGCFTLQRFALSTLPMVVILAALIMAYLNLGTGEGRASRRRRWLAQIPFSIYLAWISIATVINVASALYAASWDGWGLSSVAWTGGMVAVSAILGALVAWWRRDLAFVLVVVWALVAIAIRHGGTPALWIPPLVAAPVPLAVWGVSQWRYLRA